MKIFFYKTLIIFVFFIISIHFSLGIIKKNLKSEINNFLSKENIEYIKNKTREEIVNSLNRKNIINESDAKLIKSFFNKISDDLKSRE